MDKTKEAAKRECDLLVVTKKDGTLGQSQKGEVHFLDVAGLVYSKMTITEWVTMHCTRSQSEQPKQAIANMRCKAQRDKCVIERNLTKMLVQAMKTEEHGINTQSATTPNDRTPSESSSSPVRKRRSTTYGHFVQEHQEIPFFAPRKTEEDQGLSPERTSVCFNSTVSESASQSDGSDCASTSSERELVPDLTRLRDV